MLNFKYLSFYPKLKFLLLAFTYLQRNENWLSNDTEATSVSQDSKNIIDYQQIITAVDMLIKAIETSMQDHHLNFGRHLLKLTMDFVNGLIRDGMMVFETVFSNSRTSNADEDLPMRYIADIRYHVQVLYLD